MMDYRCYQTDANGHILCLRAQRCLAGSRPRVLFIRGFISGMAPEAFGKRVRELGAEQKDLSGVIDPQQQHDQSACGPVG